MGKAYRLTSSCEKAMVFRALHAELSIGTLACFMLLSIDVRMAWLGPSGCDTCTSLRPFYYFFKAVEPSMQMVLLRTM